MVKLTCRECAQELTADAGKCPHCGCLYPLKCAYPDCTIAGHGPLPLYTPTDCAIVPGYDVHRLFLAQTPDGVWRVLCGSHVPYMCPECGQLSPKSEKRLRVVGWHWTKPKPQDVDQHHHFVATRTLSCQACVVAKGNVAKPCRIPPCPYKKGCGTVLVALALTPLLTEGVLMVIRQAQ